MLIIGEIEMENLIQECKKNCQKYQWPLIVVGVVLFIVGFLLNASIIKILWLLIAIVVIAAGIFGVYTSRTTTK